MTGPLNKKVAGKPKVIITEDEAHLRKLFKVMMVALNTDVVALASNGNEAVEFYRKARPHLMLLDINLPGKTGDEALAEIMAEFPHAFIIMLTSVSDLKTVKKCLDLGASNYILKDTPISEMKEIIKSTWKTRLEKMRERRLGMHQKPQAASPPPPGTAPPQAMRRRPGPLPGRSVPPQGGVPGKPGPPGPHPPSPPRPGSAAPNQRPPGRQPGPAGTGPGQPPPGRRPRPAGTGPGQPPPGRRPRPAGTGPGQPPPGRRPGPAGTGPGQPPPGRRPGPAGTGPGQQPPGRRPGPAGTGPGQQHPDRKPGPAGSQNTATSPNRMPPNVPAADKPDGKAQPSPGQPVPGEKPPWPRPDASGQESVIKKSSGE